MSACTHRRFAAALTIAAATACSAEPDSAITDTSATNDGPQSARVLFVGIDGMRPDALVAANTPHMDALRDQGAWSMQASTQTTGATSSGPGWTSIFTGVEVAEHGVQANGEYDDYDPSLRTFAGITREVLGRPTAAAAHWPEVLASIHRTEDFDDVILATDDSVAGWLAAAIGNGEHDLLVAHLDDVDQAGHSTGFSADNPNYIAAIQAQDVRIGVLMAAIADRPTDERWLVAVTTDHGGDATGHGAQNDDCQNIPILVWGDGVAPGELDSATAPSHLDVFPTVLSHLGATAEQIGDVPGTSRR